MVVFGEVVTVVVGKVDTTVTTFGRLAPDGCVWGSCYNCSGVS